MLTDWIVLTGWFWLGLDWIGFGEMKLFQLDEWPSCHEEMESQSINWTHNRNRPQVTQGKTSGESRAQWSGKKMKKCVCDLSCVHLTFNAHDITLYRFSWIMDKIDWVELSCSKSLVNELQWCCHSDSNIASIFTVTVLVMAPVNFSLQRMVEALWIQAVTEHEYDDSRLDRH